PEQGCLSFGVECCGALLPRFCFGVSGFGVRRVFSWGRFFFLFSVLVGATYAGNPAGKPNAGPSDNPTPHQKPRAVNQRVQPTTPPTGGHPPRAPTRRLNIPSRPRRPEPRDLALCPVFPV